MTEKAKNSVATLSVISRFNPMVQSWFKVVILMFFVGVMIVWGIDGWGSISSRSPHNEFVMLELNRLNKTQALENFRPYIARVHPNLSSNGTSHQNFSQTHKNLSSYITQKQPNFTNFSSQSPVNLENPSVTPSWISAELEPNYSSNLLARWLAPGGEPCRESKTVEISLPGLDGGPRIELPTGNIHEFVFQALDDSGNPHCLGGDYFETDLSGEKWKSRPPIKDLGNGTYSFSLQVHPDFAGVYNLTIILLFRHFEGLKNSPKKWVFDKELRKFQVKFYKSSIQLPEIRTCEKSDFGKDVWSGRWTRQVKNDSCSIDSEGRFRCLQPNLQCKRPWCDGHLALLESNGWTYSAHCSFRLFSAEKAWSCLNGRWIFFWGDSNHCDTIRNMLNFILDVQDIKVVPRRFDMNVTNPNNPTQVVRITSIFNGHHNASGNYLGLDSLRDDEYRMLLKGFFSQERVPDTLIINSGLHDGIYWPTIRRYMTGAKRAAAFWAEVLESVRQRGLVGPEVIYRSTVATGGYARELAFNPSKMEAFNGVFLEKLRWFKVVNWVVDHFDMTYPWHYDNRCNDGVHYGRAPAHLQWRDGQIGHQYFVDLMLGHVLLNVLCAK